MVNRDYHAGKFDLFDPSICLNYNSADAEVADPSLEGKTGYIDETQSALMDQITNVVRELAQQVKDGETPDLSKVKTALTIGGADVTIAQLMEMQQVGRELSESFKSVSAGSLNGQNTEAFAKMGIAKSLGNYYSSDKGEIGTMFSVAID